MVKLILSSRKCEDEFQFGNCSGKKRGELRSPGQPMAAVPTRALVVYQLMVAIRSCLPTRSDTVAGDGFLSKI